MTDSKTPMWIFLINDHYEIYNDDALIAHKILSLSLISAHGSAGPVHIVRFPKADLDRNFTLLRHRANKDVFVSVPTSGLSSGLLGEPRRKK